MITEKFKKVKERYKKNSQKEYWSKVFSKENASHSLWPLSPLAIYISLSHTKTIHKLVLVKIKKAKTCVHHEHAINVKSFFLKLNTTKPSSSIKTTLLNSTGCCCCREGTSI